MSSKTQTTHLQSVLDALDGVVYVDDAGDIDGVVYSEIQTGLYYAVDLHALECLAARLAAGEQDAYSLWCAEEGHTEGYATEEQAALEAGFVDADPPMTPGPGPV